MTPCTFIQMFGYMLDVRIPFWGVYLYTTLSYHELSRVFRLSGMRMSDQR